MDEVKVKVTTGQRVEIIFANNFVQKNPESCDKC